MRRIVGDERFVEVFLDTPEEICRRRLAEHPDPASLRPFGDAETRYEKDEGAGRPELTLRTHELTVDACVDAILACLARKGFYRGTLRD